MEIEGVEIQHPDKLIYQDVGITKAQMVQYYAQVATFMLPYLKGRPLTLKQYPHGLKAEGYMHKHASEYFLKYLPRLKVPLVSTGETIEMVGANSARDLVYLAEQYTIEFHITLSRIEHLKIPDQIILDFDPSDNDFEKVRQAALITKDIIDKHDLKCFVKTTGSRGVHIHIPLKPDKDFKTIKPISKQLAELVHQRCPDITTLEFHKEKRGTKVFIDYLRNDYNMTAIAPYSLRANSVAGIATPISWLELQDPRLNPQSYTYKNIFARLDAIQDPWQDFFMSKT